MEELIKKHDVKILVHFTRCDNLKKTFLDMDCLLEAILSITKLIVFLMIPIDLMDIKMPYVHRFHFQTIKCFIDLDMKIQVLNGQ